MPPGNERRRPTPGTAPVENTTAPTADPSIALLDLISREAGVDPTWTEPTAWLRTAIRGFREATAHGLVELCEHLERGTPMLCALWASKIVCLGCAHELLATDRLRAACDRCTADASSGSVLVCAGGGDLVLLTRLCRQCRRLESVVE